MNAFIRFVIDEDPFVVKTSYILLQLLHMFAMWMLSIATDYICEAVAMSLYDIIK